jgi:hypothetical protein
MRLIPHVQATAHLASTAFASSHPNDILTVAYHHNVTPLSVLLATDERNFMYFVSTVLCRNKKKVETAVP